MNHLIRLFIVTIFYPVLIFGQDKQYLNKIDSTVIIAEEAFSTCDSTVFNNEEFLSVSKDGSGQLKIYKCKNKLQKIVEWVELSYGKSIRTFYSADNKLIYVTEVLNEFIWDESRNEYNRNTTQIIYSAYYYVQNDFYYYGEMKYELKYKHRVNAPEPITYTIELVKINKNYLTKK